STRKPRKPRNCGCARVLRMSERLGIYIQVPFCQTKCTYCNFHTGVVSSAKFAPYVDAICREIAGHGAMYEAVGVALPVGLEKAAADTVSIGGGGGGPLQ